MFGLGWQELLILAVVIAIPLLLVAFLIAGIVYFVRGARRKHETESR